MSCQCGAPRSAFVTDTAQGVLVCGQCGYVQESNLVTDEAFSGLAGGGGAAVGRGGRGYMQRYFGGGTGASTALDRMRAKMSEVADLMHLPPEMVEESMRVYQMLLLKRVVIQKRLQLVCCACLYYVSRIRADFNSHLMLIDFSEAVMESPFTIGSVYDIIAKTLRLKADTVDPALFLKKYVHSIGIRGDDVETVTHTANVIVSRMNRDWITQGRRPAGVIAAAVYLACRMHGFTRVRLEHITRVLNISSSTVIKRLTEVSQNLQDVLKIETVEEQNKNKPGMDAMPESLRVSRARHKEATELLKKSYEVAGREGDDPPAYISNTEVRRLEREYGHRHGHQARQQRSKLTQEWRKRRRQMKGAMQERRQRLHKGKTLLKAARRAEEAATARATAAEQDLPAETESPPCSDASSVSSDTFECQGDVRFRFRPHALPETDRLAGDPGSDEESEVSWASTPSGASIDVPRDKKETLERLEHTEKALQIPADGPLELEEEPLSFANDDPLFGLGGEVSTLVQPEPSDDRSMFSCRYLECHTATNPAAFDLPVSDAMMNKIMSSIGDSGLDNTADLEEVALGADVPPAGDSMVDQLMEMGLDTLAAITGNTKEDEKPKDSAQADASDEEQDTFNPFEEELEINEADLSDVSDTYFDDWIVTHYDEIMQRRKLWMDSHGDYLAKLRQRRKRERMQETREKRKRKKGESHLMPATITGVWGTASEAVRDSLAGSSNINMENVDRLLGKVDDLVNTHRKHGMGSILGEAMGADDLGFGQDDGFA